MPSSKEKVQKLKYLIAAFYTFTHLSETKISSTIKESKRLGNEYNIKGTILFAKEGINGTICGPEVGINKLLKYLENILPKNNLDKKFSWSKQEAFKRLRIRRKKEIVTMGVPNINPTKLVGKYVDPSKWNELIEDPSTLLIDTRNDYEIGLGSFKGAINPHTRNFREFPEWVKENLKSYIEKRKPKRIAMFCTGGIRCEKATSYLLQEGFNEIHHLQGGILRYLEYVPKDKSSWQGECYVFDQRVSIDHDLKTGKYQLCHACGQPLAPEDLKKDSYIKGVQCYQCKDHFSEADKRRFADRQNQYDKRNQSNKQTN